MHILHRTFGAAILRAPDDAAASGATTIDGATAAILAMSQAPQAKEPEPAPEPVEPESAEPSEPEPDDPQPEPEDQPADDPDAAETPSAEEPADKAEPEPPAIEPPHFWSAEDKAAFAEAPRHVQEKIAAYEAQRNTATSKAIQQAREAEAQAQEAKKAAEGVASTVAEIKARVDKQIPDAEATFKATWGDNPDWVAIQNVCLQQAQSQYPPEQAAQAATLLYQNTRAQYDADVQQLQGLRDAKQRADDLAKKAQTEADAAERNRRAAWASAEHEKLKTVAPELADPKHGPQRVQALGKFLGELGIGPAQLAEAGAAELALAYDAMRYRQAQAASKAPAQPKPKPAAAPVVKPTAAPAVVPQAQRTAQESKNRFAQKPTVDNAVAAILARSGQKG
jgi:hypothetical protein